MRCQTCGQQFETYNMVCPYCRSKNPKEIREQQISKETPYEKIRPGIPLTTYRPTERARPSIPLPTHQPAELTRPRIPVAPGQPMERAVPQISVRAKRNPDTFLLIFIAGCIVVLVILSTWVMEQSDSSGSFAGSDSLGSPGVQSAKITSSRGELEIIEYDAKIEGDYFKMLYIVGTAKNVGGKRISLGSVDAKFYDKNRNLLNNGVDTFQDLDPGETWRFKILYLGSDISEVSSYKVDVGTTL